MEETEVDEFISSAIKSNDIATIQNMLKSGMSLKEPISNTTSTPLEIALKYRKPEILYLMLDSYDLAKVDTSKESNIMPLMIASAVGYLDFLKKWKSHGLSFNVTDTKGDTPLHATARNPWRLKKLLPSVQFLLQCDVNPNALTEHGHTPIHTMAHSYREGGGTCNNFALIIEELIKSGADINCRDVYGRTALCYAEFNWKSYHCVDTLLNLGADINIEDNKESTCIDHLLSKLRQSLEPFNRFPIEYFKYLHKLVGKIIFHVIKMNVLGLYVSKKIQSNTQDLLQWADLVEKLDISIGGVVSDFSLNNISSFIEKCRLEREKMENVKLGAYSIYKLAISRENDLQKFVCCRVYLKHFNFDIQYYFKSTNYIKDFPIYRCILKLKFDAAMARKPLLPIAKNCLVSLLNVVFLADLCLEHILNQFNNRELNEFIKTYDQSADI